MESTNRDAQIKVRATRAERLYRREVWDKTAALLSVLEPENSIDWGALSYPQLLLRTVTILNHEIAAVTGTRVTAVAVELPEPEPEQEAPGGPAPLSLDDD